MTNKEDRCTSPEGAKRGAKIIGMILLGIAAAFFFGFIIQLLWNWLMPLLFGLMQITYWQGIGIFLLSSILFGRMGGRSSHNSKTKNKDSIRSQIKEEIRKEFDKEFAKAQNKSNADDENLYEKWWEDEGENAFEKYTEQHKDDAAE